jgi:hypothetical protein
MSDDRDAVGYKRPPKSRQFQPGRSGNPKGRPRGRRDIWSELAAELNGSVTVNDRGQRRSLPRIKVLVKKLVADAITGDVKARDLLMRLIERHGPPEQQAEGTAPTSAEDRKVIELMRERVIADFKARSGKSKG